MTETDEKPKPLIIFNLRTSRKALLSQAEPGDAPGSPAVPVPA